MMSLYRFLNVPLKTDYETPAGVNPSWYQARERIFTMIIRLIAILGLFGLIFTYPSLRNVPGVYLSFMAIIAALWVFGLAREINYRTRSMFFLILVYGLGVVEVISFGFSADSFAFLMGFVVVSAVLASRRGAMVALALSLTTIGAFATLIGSGRYVPIAVVNEGRAILPSSVEEGIVSLLVFTGGALAVTAFIVTLLESLQSAWQKESASLNLLQQERDQLEQHVASRTRELQEAEFKYRTLVEQLPLAVYRDSADGVALTHYISPQIETILGYSREAWEQDPELWHKNVHPEDRERALMTIQLTLENGVSVSEYRLLSIDGREIWVRDNATLVRDENGQPQFVQGTLEDITAQKQADEQIRKLSQAVEQGGDSVIVMDRSGRIEYVNPKFTELTGYTLQDAIGKSPVALMQRLTDEPDFSRAEWWQTVNAGNIWRGEFRNRRKDGAIIWEAASIAPIFSDGQITNFIEIKQDVTARRQAEEEVRKLSRAVEQSGNSIVITDLNGDIEYVNPQFTKATGYSFEEVVGKNPRLLKSGRQSQEFYQKLWASISSGKTWRGIFHNKRKDGLLYWELATIAPVINPNGDVTHYIAIKEDITRQKETEDALQQSYQAQSVLNSLLSLSLENQTLEEMLVRALSVILTIPWLPTQPKGGIFLMDGARKALTLKASQNLDAPILTLCARVPIGHCLCGLAAAEGKTQFANCVDGRHANAYPGMKPHGHYNVPILSRDEVLGVLVLYLDEGRTSDPREEAFLEAVTNVLASMIHDKQAQQALAEARDHALEASAFKSQLLSRVSHELRTPLSGVLGYAELLQFNAFGEINDEQHKAASQIVNSARYLEYMIQDLLDQAQIDAKTITLYNEPFSPSGLVARVETSLSSLARNKGLYIQSEIAADLPTSIVGDENRLQQVVVNLVGNAVKYTRQGGVAVRLYCPSETRWAIEVRDTGAGIPAEARAFIFDPFRQVDNSITRENRGTGLGLSITKQLVELMGGEITLESEVDQGSVFTVYLPLITTTGEKE